MAETRWTFWHGATAPEPLISAEQCVEQGGHCHARTGMSRPMNPPQYEERCRHCGHVRWAIPREPFEYLEDPR